MKLNQKTKDQIWWMLISVDYDYARITIAEHELGNDFLTLWLEDKQDFKNTIDECLQLDIKVSDFAKFIRTENLNSYQGTKMHPRKQFVYECRIEINEPIKWYQEDASIVEQQWAREAIVKHILTTLVEGEINDTNS